MSPPPPPRQLAALCAVADALAGVGVRWVLAGSAGRALLGCPVRPRDIDLEVEPTGAHRAARALGAELAEALGGGRSSLRGHSERSGIALDITCDLEIDAPGGRLPADFELQWKWSRPGPVCGRTIRVAPLEESLCRAIVLADWSHLARVGCEAARAEPPIRLASAYVSERLSSARVSANR